MDYEIKLELNPAIIDIQVLGDGISEYAKQMKALKPIEFFGLFIRNKENTILAGCNGDILYGCLYIGQLWVTESLRGHGYGSKLISNAEKYGIKNNCSFATVNTMDWEALSFYQKHGYKIEFERHGFEKNSIFYFLRKDFKT